MTNAPINTQNKTNAPINTQNKTNAPRNTQNMTNAPINTQNMTAHFPGLVQGFQNKIGEVRQNGCFVSLIYNMLVFIIENEYSIPFNTHFGDYISTRNS
jgi:hypothetical protein